MESPQLAGEEKHEMSSVGMKQKSDFKNWPDHFDEASSFLPRHVGPNSDQIKKMLAFLEIDSLATLIDETIPQQIRTSRAMDRIPALSEVDALSKLAGWMKENSLHRSLIGMGYSDCITPAVIQRNILENPGWYTQYTPYQAEIAQGRLEALLNFQTLVADLTGLPVSNASLLDEATAAAEAMAMCLNVSDKSGDKSFFVDRSCHPQTIAVLETRAEPLGVRLEIGDSKHFDPSQIKVLGGIVQYPSSEGEITDPTPWIKKMQAAGARAVVASDLLALTLLTPPGELGADIVIGSSQRLGVPLGYGGPHAAFLSCKDDLKRLMPGRIVGVSTDSQGKRAIRLALQTREQHIRREKATSNICTAQVLLAVIASMYAVYHGPEGLKNIAQRVHRFAVLFANGLRLLGYLDISYDFFDTVKIKLAGTRARDLVSAAEKAGFNLRTLPDGVSVSFDEKTNAAEVEKLFAVFATAGSRVPSLKELSEKSTPAIPGSLQRTSQYLTHPVFNTHHSETQMLRYIRSLEAKDLSLTTSMIALGSCTMKLNATSEMLPVTWKEVGGLHPFVPLHQANGYQKLFKSLESHLAELTGFDAVSLQPNAGSQGEYAGLLVIRAFHQSKGQNHRDVCLIPRSAHGTNPASAAMSGMRVVVVDCDSSGNVDVEDLKRKSEQHQEHLAALMVTYPSTHGVFETAIKEICQIVHQNGGQVYMDGANMNAQIGLCRPGEYGPDVCHLNLHKTFCIPHGGGGPGMGPICVKSHLAPFLPGHPVVAMAGEKAIGAISAAPWGSPSILPISWMYIEMMGGLGLKHATEVAILNANYVARKLVPHYPVLYQGLKGRVAHECIIDLRPIKAATGIDVEDVAKRLMDYGFHAPTISFPVPGTMMIEPTESEALDELDRFCDAMIHIREEIREIEQGKMDPKENPLKRAPHTAEQVTTDQWSRPYSREKAAYPVSWVRARKFWPSVSRIDNVAGDRNLICTCPSVEEYS